jgi:DNA-directed RNA polymerase subunit RPC12/RpoP
MQSFQCFNKNCGKQSSVKNAEEGQHQGERIYVCEHCGSRHNAIQRPQVTGAPALFDIVSLCADNA